MLQTGGDLIRETVRSRKVNILLLLLVMVVVAVAALSYWNSSTSYKETSSSGTFEDQYITFSYPPSLVAVQYTYEDYTLVDFYNSNDTSNFDNYVGNVRFSTSNLTNLQRVYNEGSLGKYESYRTWQGTDTNGPYIFILLGSGDTKFRTLQMDFKSEYQTAYSEILKTLKINKIPA